MVPEDPLPMPLQTATTAAAANHPPSVAVVLVQDCVCNGDLELPWDVAQGLTGGMAAQLVHHRAAATHPGHMLPPGFNRRDRGRQISAFFPVLTPQPRPAEPPSAGPADTPRRGHSFARMWCELTTTAAGSFALPNFGAWLLKVKARAGDLVLLCRTASAGGTEYMHMLRWSFVEARALLALAACTSRPRSAPGAGKRWPLPLELTVKVLQALDAGLVASAIRYSSSAPS